MIEWKILTITLSKSIGNTLKEPPIAPLVNRFRKDKEIVRSNKGV